MAINDINVICDVIACVLVLDLLTNSFVIAEDVYLLLLNGCLSSRTTKCSAGNEPMDPHGLSEKNDNPQNPNPKP